MNANSKQNQPYYLEMQQHYLEMQQTNFTFPLFATWKPDRAYCV